jgi:hypothetical protein
LSIPDDDPGYESRRGIVEATDGVDVGVVVVDDDDDGSTLLLTVLFAISLSMLMFETEDWEPFVDVDGVDIDVDVDDVDVDDFAANNAILSILLPIFQCCLFPRIIACKFAWWEMAGETGEKYKLFEMQYEKLYSIGGGVSVHRPGDNE